MATTEQLAEAQAAVTAAQQYIQNLTGTNIDPLSWVAMKAYIDASIAYALLAQQSQG